MVLNGLWWFLIVVFVGYGLIVLSSRCLVVLINGGGGAEGPLGHFFWGS